MSDHLPLTDRTMVISGASRGIGLAIALAAARQGANVALLTKTLADAAAAILSRPARKTTGNCFLDTDALSHYAGLDDFSRYGGGPNPTPDLFLD
nr:SDR family NAD(P)-dependent oxidoreductase [Nocardia miyunensis]